MKEIIIQNANGPHDTCPGQKVDYGSVCCHGPPKMAPFNCYMFCSKQKVDYGSVCCHGPRKWSLSTATCSVPNKKFITVLTT
jgi:hypothetical protein